MSCEIQISVVKLCNFTKMQFFQAFLTVSYVGHYQISMMKLLYENGYRLKDVEHFAENSITDV